MIRSLNLRLICLGIAFVQLVSITFAVEPIQYCNPVSPSDAEPWEDYGFGDPFVMRYNGRYYLYPSTRDDSVGVKCWSSRDLVNWRYEGLCTTDPTSKGAYAPELFRGNDAFYMTTSPAGNGHYIYRAEKPTGPFERVTDNFGHSIDGSVFIDDDGQAWFYSAGEQGIAAYAMTSPVNVAKNPVNVGAFMNGWTEGPSVFKHDGVYFITYTGNHVFSRGYRINAGSGDSPTDFAPMPDLPVLVATEGSLYGIGHNSVVKGPNLDVYYIVYHSLTGSGKTRGWPVREMNIDRLVLDRESLSVSGPTRSSQTISPADIACWFDESADLANWSVVALTSDASNVFEPELLDEGRVRLEPNSALVTRENIDGDFTAEFNLAIVENKADADFGVVFCWQNAENYALLKIDVARNKAVLELRSDTPETREYELPKLFGEKIDFTKLRSIQIERSNDLLSFYIDDRLFAQDSFKLPRGGAFGYFARGGGVVGGYFGATGACEGRSVEKMAEPLEGRIVMGPRRSANGKECVDVVIDGKKRGALPLVKEDYVEIKLNSERGGRYDLAMRYDSKRACVVSVTLDELPFITFNLNPTRQGDTPTFASAVVRGLDVPEGECVLKITNLFGEFLVADARLAPGQEITPLDVALDKPFYTDGKWRVENDSMTLVGDGYGKRVYGEKEWGDLRLEAILDLQDERTNAGLIFRARNFADGRPNIPSKKGADFAQGYCVLITKDSVVLGKLNYGWQTLAEVPIKKFPKEPVKLSVDALGSNIKVFINDFIHPIPVINYVDPDPWLCGRVGVCGRDSNLRVDKLSVGACR